MKKIFVIFWILTWMLITNSSFAEDDMRICTMEYAPVCAKVQIQCIKDPCDPIYETFWNKCMMGGNSLATFAYDWECKIEEETNTWEILDMVNPASVKCEENWWNLDLDSWNCTFRNWKVCNEWAFFRWECSSNIDVKLIKKDITVKSETDNIKVDLVYPEITNSVINKKISDYMNNYLEEFKKEIWDEKISENWKNEIYSSYEAKMTSWILSLKLNIYTFTWWAHWNTDIKTFNFISKTWKEIIIKNKNFIKKVSNYSINYYNKLIDEWNFNSDKDMVKEWLEPKLENFQNWVISWIHKEWKNYHITFDFIFPQYQIAPYSEWIQTITIDLNDLK